MSALSFDGYKKNGLFDVFVLRQDRLSYFDVIDAHAVSE